MSTVECQFCPALFRTLRSQRAHAIFHPIDERMYDDALSQWYAHLLRDHHNPAGADDVLRAYTRAPAPEIDPDGMEVGQMLCLVFAGFLMKPAVAPPPARDSHEWIRRVYYNLDPSPGRAKTYA